MKTPTYEEIKPYIEKKLVSEQVHPENGDVRIFNYTQTCQFSKAWDDVTRQCRGLILNVATGEVIARPFPKFFNYAEHVQNAWPIPDDTPVISEKLDGSLGILYWLGEEGKKKAYIATRGSFASDQSVWATKWFNELPYGFFDIKSKQFLSENVTYLFEIIYPENRIVVNYDYSGLVLLAGIDIKTGLTVPLAPVKEPMRTCRTHPMNDVEELMKLDEPNSEGFVIFYPKENVRMKIKFPEYVRLHKIITGVSEIGVWEILKDNGDFAPLLEKVPDEFFKWVGETKQRLVKAFDEIAQEAVLQFASIQKKDPADRKEWAEEIKKMKNPGIGFAILDDKDYKQIIWKMVRPHGPRVFKTDIDL